MSISPATPWQELISITADPVIRQRRYSASRLWASVPSVVVGVALIIIGLVDKDNSGIILGCALIVLGFAIFFFLRYLGGRLTSTNDHLYVYSVAEEGLIVRGGLRVPWHAISGVQCVSGKTPGRVTTVRVMLHNAESFKETVARHDLRSLINTAGGGFVAVDVSTESPNQVNAALEATATTGARHGVNVVAGV